MRFSLALHAERSEASQEHSKDSSNALEISGLLNEASPLCSKALLQRTLIH